MVRKSTSPAKRKSAAFHAEAPVQPKLLSGGNPQIPKGDGDAPVQQYISAMPGWKRAIGSRIDQLVTQTIPAIKKAVRWNTPFYGIEGQGWFLCLHCFNKYVKVAFLNGDHLNPQPPISSKHPAVRYLHIHEQDTLDEAQLVRWIQQAAAHPGDTCF
jgi:hypothetical protein